MANEISFMGAAGSNLYARFMRDGEIWNTVDDLFETWSDLNVTEYGIALAQQGSSGWYIGSIPTEIPAGTIDIAIMKRIGGSQAVGDMFCGGVRASWSGTERVDLVDIALGAGGLINIDYEVTDIRS